MQKKEYVMKIYYLLELFYQDHHLVIYLQLVIRIILIILSNRLAPGELRCKKIRHLVDRLRYYREQERYYRGKWNDACTCLKNGDFRAMTPVPIDGVYRPFDTAIETYGDIYHPPDIPPMKCSRMGDRTCEFPPPIESPNSTKKKTKKSRSRSAFTSNNNAVTPIKKTTNSNLPDPFYVPNSLSSCYHKTQDSLSITRAKASKKPNDHVIVGGEMRDGVLRPLTPEHDDTEYRRLANDRYTTTNRSFYVPPYEAVKNPRKKYYDVEPKFHPRADVTKCLDWPGYDMYCSF